VFIHRAASDSNPRVAFIAPAAFSATPGPMLDGLPGPVGAKTHKAALGRRVGRDCRPSGEPAGQGLGAPCSIGSRDDNLDPAILGSSLGGVICSNRHVGSPALGLDALGTGEGLLQQCPDRLRAFEREFEV
jgi:hypothetical protein